MQESSAWSLPMGSRPAGWGQVALSWGAPGSRCPTAVQSAASTGVGVPRSVSVTARWQCRAAARAVLQRALRGGMVAWRCSVLLAGRAEACAAGCLADFSADWDTCRLYWMELPQRAEGPCTVERHLLEQEYRPHVHRGPRQPRGGLQRTD